MPSSDVPLMSPMARITLLMDPFPCMVPPLCRTPLAATQMSSRRKPRIAMTTLKSDFLKIMTERGFTHQCSDPEGLDKLAAEGRVVAYVGYDCTAPSLHVGSLLSIMMLTWLQKCGGKPIALMGGGTTRVGDPSGKDETRQMRSVEEIEANKNGIKQVFAKFLTFGEGRNDALMVDNAEWLAKLNYIE